jgi:hypothetical protein
MSKYNLYPQWLKDRLVFKPSKDDGLPLLVQITYPPTTCEDCRLEVADPPRVIKHKKVFSKSGIHWRTQCKDCKCWRDPITQKFNLGQAAANLAYDKFATAATKAKTK